ncbi:MAG TPA: membrane protein insertase YidC, partial [Nitrosospira sp.]
MDTQKLVLFLIFSTSMLFLWEAWQKETRPPPPAPAIEGAANQPSAQQNETPVPGEKLASAQQGTGVPAENAAPVKPGGLLDSGDKIVVKTDLVTAEIDTAGGDLRRLELLDHPDKGDKNKPFALLQSKYDHVYVAQSGMIGEGLPTHKTRYTAEPGTHTLAPGQD